MFHHKRRFQALINTMMAYLREISDTAYRLLREDNFSDAYEEIENLAPDDDDSNHTLSVELKAVLAKCLKLLSVVDFNSGKYNINLIKPYLFQWIASHTPDDKENERKKTNSSLLCL